MKDYLLIHISEGYEYTDRCQINIVPVMPWEAFNFTGMVWFHMSSSREGSNQYKVILNDYDETFLSWLKWFLPGWQYSHAQSTLSHQLKLFWWIMVAQHLIKITLLFLEFVTCLYLPYMFLRENTINYWNFLWEKILLEEKVKVSFVHIHEGCQSFWGWL